MDIARRIYLIKKFLDHTLNRDEEEEFQLWLKEDQRNADLVDRICDRKETGIRMEFYSRLQDSEEVEWNGICQKAGVGNRHKRWSLLMIRYAAVIALVFVVGYAAVHVFSLKQAQIVAVTPLDSIVPGAHRAIVELADGECVVLGDSSNLQSRKFEGGELLETKSELVIAGDPAGLNKDSRHKIIVPRGAEYQIVLADGTRVWLNSDSRLEFPAAFGSRERVVKLAGEAYFDVKHDAECPFRVQTDQATIQVLGTSFNVNTYGGVNQTTLVSGSVELNLSQGSYRLKPGEQGIVENGHVEVKEVNVREFVAWKDGLFVFRNRRLEEVLTTLGRWYDLQVFYQNERVKDLHFTGNIFRHASVSDVLVLLEETELLKFEVKGKTLIVKEK